MKLFVGVPAPEVATRREHGGVARLLMEAGAKEDGSMGDAEIFDAGFQVKGESLDAAL